MPQPIGSRVSRRETKGQVDLPQLRGEWKTRAAEQGLGRRELETLVAERSHSRDSVESEQLVRRYSAGRADREANDLHDARARPGGRRLAAEFGRTPSLRQDRTLKRNRQAAAPTLELGL
jgi:hypothetical protein